MPTLLYDENLSSELDQARGVLEREDWSLASARAGAKLFAEAASLRPDLVVVSDRGWDPWPYLDEFRSDPESRTQRILYVAAEGLGSERREALAGAGVGVVEGPVGPKELAAAIASTLNVPTRVTLRTRVVFEIKGRTCENDAFYGKLLDVSTGGFLLEADRDFGIGEFLYCFFSLTTSSPVIFATARTVRARLLGRGLHEYGLEFTDIRLDDRRRIGEFVLRQSGVARELVGA